MVCFYFSYVDPWGVQPRPLQDLVVFVVVTATIVVATFLSSMRLFRPLQEWRERLHRGADPGEVPAHLRRRALNRPLIAATFSMTGWTLAGIFYLPYQLGVVGFGLEQAWRVFAGIVFVGGPVASALSFLVAEYYSRRDVPLFFPAGRIERSGVLRVPILVRLGATFFITSVLPPLLMMMVSVSLVHRFGGELPEEIRPLWMQLLRTQAYIVAATGGASFVMALLNEYYAIVARVVEREGGVVTQFLGDGVVVVFGGPLRPLPEHARHAVRAAIALERALAERNAAGGERLLAGVGICTGDMIAGNVGAGGRVTYTIVGDAVNQAARLQVKTRDLGASILLTESTRAALGETNGLVLRPCGAVPLKGVAAPVEVYAVEA